MPGLHHVPLFHPRMVRERAACVDRSLFSAHERTVGVWLDHLRSGVLDDTKETSLHGGFLERIFGDLLGYSTMALARNGTWDLVAEKTVLAGGSADGAIGLFSRRKSRVFAPIELKGASQLLEHARGRSLTPIQQGWDYANKTPESRWIIVSNYRETRLYAKSRGQAAFESFPLEDLAKESGFTRFVGLLGRDAILGESTAESSPLSQMLVASERTERELTERFYAEYRGIRARLFDELRRVHPSIPADELLAKTQTILDRVLFAAFAEDRQLIPPNTVTRAFEHRDPYNPRSIWKNFIAVFKSIDKGNPTLTIPAYNGGLFRNIQDVEELEVSDEACGWLKRIGEYDFSEDVSVHVLGHIFEQSITDLELLRKDALSTDSSPPSIGSDSGTQKKPSKRKTEGIFYTPSFVTNFLIRETLGHAMAEAWERAGGAKATNRKAKVVAWLAYQDELRRLRVLDPACGSGAFLVAAFDALAQEFERTNRMLAELEWQQTSLFELTKTVLNENLFGIDKSGESIEISRLSLWLKTAERGKKLTFLDRNIRQGNSVVSDSKLDPWAFDWQKGRVARRSLERKVPAGEGVDEMDARWREGFDVVIGNPPYVRQELLTQYKEHWSSEFHTYDGAADIFVYFFERGLEQLKPGGRLGFIVSNKWLRGGYAEKLRELLGRECTVESIVDFGHAPIFPDADAFPCIITLRKSVPASDHEVEVTLYPREELGRDLVASYVDTHHFGLRQSGMHKAGWVLEPPGVQKLLAKIQHNGLPLEEYAGVKPLYGIKTGRNEAFLVDQLTKERLCREHPTSASVMKKYLRGQDVTRWSSVWQGLWIILISSSANRDWPWSSQTEERAEKTFAKALPAIHRHLKRFEEQLRVRTDQGRFWWELRACAYYDQFEKPKLVYPDILWKGDFCFAEAGVYVNNTSYLLPVDDKWLLACLNSPAIWNYSWRKAQHAKDEALRMFSEFVELLPIPRPKHAQSERVSRAVGSLIGLTRSAADSIRAFLDVLRVEYDVEVPGQALEDFASLSSDVFVKEVKKRRVRKASRLSPAGLAQLRKLFDAEAAIVLEKRARVLTLEQSVASAVHDAFELDETDLATLRETAPPRMPPGW
jgi:type I restriction-modification system DNA methylase subunit